MAVNRSAFSLVYKPTLTGFFWSDESLQLGKSELMDTFLGKLLIEIGLFTLLGVLYYFYQKKKILKYEADKGPLVMGYILQSCLTERGETPNLKLDAIIEAIDDYLQNNTSTPPRALLKHYADLPECSHELKDVIEEGLKEMADGKE